MTQDEHRRRAGMTAALRFAATHPSLGLGYEFQDEVRAAFATRRELVAALHALWLQTVCRRLDQLAAEPQRAALSPAQRARVAWAECAATNPCLRRTLQRHEDEVPPAARRQEELLISSGTRPAHAVPSPNEYHAFPATQHRAFPVAACVA